MNNSQLILIGSSLILATTGVVMIATNPDNSAYQEYGANQISLQLQEKGCAEIPKSLGGFLEAHCKSVVKQITPELENAIAQNTQRRNFVLFSIYTTDFSLPTPLPSYHFETLGCFNTFFILKAEET